MQEPKRNNEITAPELRIIDETGENIGVMSKDDAQKLADERELDLILITPNAEPPIAKIVDYDKFRYQQEKEQKKQQRQKAPEMKRVQISPRTAANDLQISLKKLEKFLEGGHRVEIQLTLRGREKGNKDWARTKLEEFLEMISVPYKVTSEIKTGGRGLLTQISPE